MASNVIPFRASADKRKGFDYAPGVIPFDRNNPHHVAAWNAMWTMGKAEHDASRS